MKASKYSEAQIVTVVKQVEEGNTVAEVCRKAGICYMVWFSFQSDTLGHKF